MCKKLLFVLTFICCLPMVAAAEEDGKSRWSFITHGSYGLSKEIAHSSENYDLLSVGAGLQYDFSDAVALRIEALPYMLARANLDNLEDVRGFGWVSTILYRFSQGDVRPYVGFNAGTSWFDEEIPVGGATTFNFLLGLEGGLEFIAGENTALFVGYRYFHVSNSDTGDRNPGINLHSALVGLRILF